MKVSDSLTLIFLSIIGFISSMNLIYLGKEIGNIFINIIGLTCGVITGAFIMISLFYFIYLTDTRSKNGTL